MSDDRLNQMRQRIDAIDLEVQQLLQERARSVVRVGEIKRETSQVDPVFYRPDREAQILRRVASRNDGPLSNSAMVRLFTEIISSCLALEHPLRIAYLGPEGTFTQAAAVKRFGGSAALRAMATINDVFREVEASASDYGIVPVENSTEGMVNHTLDSLLRSNLRICGEVELRIHHHLMLLEDVPQPNIDKIYSHQQSFAQCRTWLDVHWPTIERVAVSSNGEAARLAAEDGNAAAIAGDFAARRYGLQIHAANIEDEPNNTTRFLVLGRHEVGPSGSDKTSLLVYTRNEPGALYQILEPFHRLGVNLTRLETRPARIGQWSYVFFIDLDGHDSDQQVANAIRAVSDIAIDVRVLGAYPKAFL